MNHSLVYNLVAVIPCFFSPVTSIVVENLNWTFGVSVRVVALAMAGTLCAGREKSYIGPRIEVL